jgi:hypothetical protein
MAEIDKMLSDGTCSLDDFIRQDGSSDWKPLGDVSLKAEQLPEKKRAPDWVWWIVVPVCIVGGGTLGAFMAQTLWLRILLGLAGALALTIGAYITGKIVNKIKTSQWLKRWKRLSNEEKRDCWEKTESYKKKKYWNLLSSKDKDMMWSLLKPKQKYDIWSEWNEDIQKAWFPKLPFDTKIKIITQRENKKTKYWKLLSPEEKDMVWSLLKPKQKYDIWSEWNKDAQKAWFPKLPFDTRIKIVTQRASADVEREDAASDAALARQNEYEAAYDGAFAADLYMNFDPGAGYGLFDSVESARQKYEYLHGIAEYYAAVCNASIACMRFNAALYARRRAEAIVYVQEITEISSRLPVKEREVFETTALNNARKVKEIQFSGELPEIAVSADYVFGSTIEGLFSGMSRRDKKQLEKSVAKTLKGMSAENRLKAAGAVIAIGAAVEIGSAILNKIDQALEAKRQYKEAEAQLIPQINSIVEQEQEANNVSNRLNELITSIDKSIDVYKKIFSDVYGALYPAGDPSKSPEARAAREKSGEVYFTMDEKQKIMELAQVAGYMMKIVDAGI